MPRYKSILNTASFIVFGSVLVVISLAPMDLTPTLRMPPDFLFCFIFVFLVRDPQNVPVLSVIFVSLLADFLWFRPIGLTTLIILLASEILRWIITTREQISLPEEFIYITLILSITTLCQELVKFFTTIPSLSLEYILNYVLFTLILYLLIIILIKVITTVRSI